MLPTDPPARALAGLGAGACALLLLHAGAAQAQRFNVRSYTNTDGLPQRQVFAILQDRVGYLWFGTYGGASRYDGEGFRTWDTGSGLSANTVLDLAEDGAGRLVIATQGGGLCVREDGRFRQIRRGPGLVSDDVQRLTRDRDGTLWVATEAGITHLVNPAVHYTTADGLPSNSVLSVLRDRRGRLWAATKRGLALFTGGRFVPFHPERLGGSLIRTLLAWGDDLLVGGDDVLFVLRGGDLLPFPAPLPPGQAREIHDAALTPQGALWLATLDGAFRWDGRVLERFGRRQGLAADGIHRVLVDREGNVWFGTEAGVSKLGPGPFVGYTEADGLCHPFIRALGEDALGRLLVGTRSGISVYDGIGFTTLREGLPNERIYGFATLPDGSVLIATREGMALWDGRVVRRTFHRAEGLPDEYVTSLLARPDGSVVVGTAHGVALFRSGRLVPVADPALSGAYVLAMKDDAQGRVWIGLRSGGVAVWDGVAARLLPLDARLGGETVWAIDRDPRGRMWIGTNGFGVFIVDGAKVSRLTTREGLVNDFVWQVLADEEGTVWCYTSHGLDRTDGKTFTHFGVDDGLVDLEGSTSASLRQKNGDLWFGSGTGLSRFVPSRLVPNAVPPPVVIENVTAGGSAVRDGERLPHDAGAFRFRFSALSFRAESALRFRHRLIPADPAWSERSADRRIEYGRLAPGRYVFEVIAENDDGLPSRQPARFSFQIRPPWWGTLWFRLALLASVAFSGIGIGTWRSRWIEADRRRLARLVAERTAELEEQSRELRRLATSDALTGVANRRHFLDGLESELKRASRLQGGGTVSLLLIDLDHFKEVNDTWGHTIGDRLLAAVAARVQKGVRSTDLIARYGGEEFAILLPETRLEGAQTTAEKIRESIGEAPFLVEALAIAMTISIGVASLEAITGWDEGLSRRLIDRADAALYSAKRLGRNRVEVAEPEVPSAERA